MKRDLVKAIVLGALGVLCVVRGFLSLRYDDNDYSGAGIYAGVARAIKTEMIRQANNNALQMIAVGTLVLLSASKPWNEYRREKSERDELYSISEDE